MTGVTRKTKLSYVLQATIQEIDITETKTAITLNCCNKKITSMVLLVKHINRSVSYYYL